METKIPVGLSCDTRVQTIRLDETIVGFGGKREDAIDDFFDKLLDQSAAQLRCSGGTCPDADGCCVPEIVDTGELERMLHCNRVRHKDCAHGVRWKCFWTDQSTVSTDVKVRCTCVPRPV